jgi:hypothetical protein
MGSEPRVHESQELYASPEGGMRKKEKARSKHDLASWAKLPNNKQPAAGFISWLSEVGEALPSFAHKPRVPKRWPLRPRS